MRTYTKLSHLVVFIVALLLIGCSASNSGASGSQYISVNGGSQLSESNPFALNLQSTSNQVTQSNVPLNSTLNLDFYSALDLKKINKDGGVSKYIQLKSQLGTLTTYKDSYISQNNKNIVLNTDKLATNTNYKLMVNYLPLANGGYITGFISFGSGATNPLTVTMLSPKNNESNIGVNPVITFTFNQLANNVNFNNIHLYRNSILASNLESITNIVQDTLGNYSFVPLNSLTKNINYYVVFESGIKDSVGNSLQTATFKFNTIDNSKPTATLLTPVQNQRNVSIYPLFAVYFSESVVGYESGVVVKDSAGNSISLARFDFQNNLLSFNSLKPLEPNSLYSINLESKITDLSGNRLDNYTFYFTTGESMYLTAYLLNPIPNSLNNVNNPKFRIRFSNYMNGINLSNFKLQTTSGTLINLTNMNNDSSNQGIYEFSSDRLFSNTQYNLSILNAVDYLNNKLPDSTFSFATGQNNSVTVTMINPANGSYIESGILNNLALKFSESMLSTSASIMVCDQYPDLYESYSCGFPVGNFTLGSDMKTLTFNTSSPLSKFSYRNVFLTLSGNKNITVAGDILESTTFNFTTGNPVPITVSISSPDITKPIYPLTVGSGIDIKFSNNIRNYYTLISGVCTKPYTWVNSSSIVLKEANSGNTVSTFFAESCISSATFKMILKENLKPNTQYFISFNRYIQSVNGEWLLPTTINFTTGLATAPTVAPYGFTNGQTGLSSGFVPSLSFSQEVNVLNSDIDFKNSIGNAVSFQIIKNTNNIWNIIPTSSLPAGTYNITVINTIKSIYGINLPNSVTYSFTIQNAVPPAVTSVNPTNGSTNVPLNTNITVYFNQPVTGNCSTGAYSLLMNNSSLSFNISSCSSNSVTIVPANTSSLLATYTLTVKGGLIQNSSGQTVSQYSMSYTTIPGVDTLSPTVWLYSPANKWGFSPSFPNIGITFSEEVTGVSSSSIYLERCTNYQSTSTTTGKCNGWSGEVITGAVDFYAMNYLDSSVDYKMSFSTSTVVKNSWYCLHVPNKYAITDIAKNPLNYDSTQCLQSYNF